MIETEMSHSRSVLVWSEWLTEYYKKDSAIRTPLVVFEKWLNSFNTTWAYNADGQRIIKAKTPEDLTKFLLVEPWLNIEFEND